MGGIGSGRTGGKRRVDSVRKIDVRTLHREGVFKQQHAKLSWYYNDLHAGSIDIFPEGDVVRLEYNVRLAGNSDFRKVEQVISLTRTTCWYGGSRSWIICPNCLRRVALLYLCSSQFICRYCSQIVHDSVNEGEYDKMLRRSRKLRSKLNADLLAFGKTVSKTPGMHWRTYERLNSELRQVEREMAVQLAEILGV